MPTSARPSPRTGEPGKDLLPTGGPRPAAALTDLGLIDGYRIVVHPVVLGGGKRSYPIRKSRIDDLRLIESRVVDSRVVLLCCERAGRGR